jgi:hypothetical protein
LARAVLPVRVAFAAGADSLGVAERRLLGVIFSPFSSVESVIDRENLRAVANSTHYKSFQSQLGNFQRTNLTSPTKHFSLELTVNLFVGSHTMPPENRHKQK